LGLLNVASDAASVVRVLDAVATVFMIERQLILLGKAYLALHCFAKDSDWAHNQ